MSVGAEVDDATVVVAGGGVGGVVSAAAAGAEAEGDDDDDDDDDDDSTPDTGATVVDVVGVASMFDLARRLPALPSRSCRQLALLIPRHLSRARLQWRWRWRSRFRQQLQALVEL